MLPLGFLVKVKTSYIYENSQCQRSGGMMLWLRGWTQKDCSNPASFINWLCQLRQIT